MANPSPKLAAYDNIIDADGHILEPPDAWEKYIDPKFRDRALRVRVGSDGREYLEVDGRPSKFFNIKALTFLGGMGGNAGDCHARDVRGVGAIWLDVSQGTIAVAGP
jgi:hypothetical protein